MSFTLPPAQKWGKEDKARKKKLFDDLRKLLHHNGSLTRTGALVYDAIAEVCNPLLTPDTDRAKHWLPYRDGEKPLHHFFDKWLEYNPSPVNPGRYIERWDYLANTVSGLKLTNEDRRFKKWFVRFLDLRGVWINSTSSTSTLKEWMHYKGTDEHPFNINDYEIPPGGFQSFNQFFLRNIKPKLRPLCKHVGGENVVSPCDGGVFYLTHGALTGNAYQLPGKSQDTFQIEQAIPGYGAAFVGGPLLDILLWFTDYHHFMAPVSGTIIHQGEYQGSYNYDFDNFDANDPYAPGLPPDSDRVGWYKSLGKHKRFVWVINTGKLGLVAMIAIGFWGVGSIDSAVSEGDTVKKGQYMGHFGYGGSSIVLAFEPNKNLQFAAVEKRAGHKVDGHKLPECVPPKCKPVSDPDHPLLVNVRQCLGQATPALNWLKA